MDRRDVYAEGGRLSLFGQAEVKDLGTASCADAEPALCKDLAPHGFRLYGLVILLVVHGVIKAQFPCGMLFFSQQVQFLMTCHVQFCRGMESWQGRFFVPHNYLRGLPVASPSATPLVADFCSRVKPCLSAYCCSRSVRIGPRDSAKKKKKRPLQYSHIIMYRTPCYGCICIYIYMYSFQWNAYIHAHMYVYIYIYVFTCVYIYTYVYVFVYTLLGSWDHNIGTS